MGYGPGQEAALQRLTEEIAVRTEQLSAYVLLEDLEKERNTVFDQMQKGQRGRQGCAGRWQSTD